MVFLFSRLNWFSSCHIEAEKKMSFYLLDDLILLFFSCHKLALLIKTPPCLLHRYQEENKNVALGEFKFGPLFMRLCYELDLEVLAVELIKDKVKF